jgi:hypothetical protein
MTAPGRLANDELVAAVNVLAEFEWLAGEIQAAAANRDLVDRQGKAAGILFLDLDESSKHHVLREELRRVGVDDGVILRWYSGHSELVADWRPRQDYIERGIAALGRLVDEALELRTPEEALEFRARAEQRRSALTRLVEVSAPYPRGA